MAAKGAFVDFKAIKREVSILRVLEHYGLMERFRRSGDSLSGPCPLHGGDNKSAFRVSISKNCFNCFGECKAGGNVLDFVAKKEGASIREAALLMQKWFGVESALPGPEKKDSKPAPENASGNDEAASTASENGQGGEPDAEKAEAPASGGITKNPPLAFYLSRLKPDHPYLQERGLTRETIETFGLGFCEKGLMAGRICIPIHDADGQLVAYAGRWPGTPPEDKTRYKLPKEFRKSLEVFNLHRAMQADSADPLIIVEGFFGCMNVWQAGIRRVAALMGSSLSAAQAASIVRCVGSRGRIALLYDNDDAGMAGREQALAILAPHAFVKAVCTKRECIQSDRLSADEIIALFN